MVIVRKIYDFDRFNFFFIFIFLYFAKIKLSLGACKMASCLRALVILVEDTCVLSQLLVPLVLGNLMFFSGLLRHQACMHMHMMQYIYEIKTLKHMKLK